MKRIRTVKLILILLIMVNITVINATQKVEQITEGHDDRFKTEAGIVFEDIDLLMMKDPGIGLYIALRFQDLDIQSDWLINNATLSLQTWSSYAFDPDARVTIYGIDVNDCEDFDDSDPFELPYTSANVVWNISDWTIYNTWHNVTVTNIVQEIVNRQNFGEDSSLGFMILSVAGSQRSAQSYEDNPSDSAKLYLRYNEAPPLPPGLPEGAEYNQTVEGYDIYWIPGYGQVTSVKDPNFRWDSSDEVYGFQEKTAYSNVTDRFYIFGGQDNVRGRTIQYLSKPRLGQVWDINVTLESFISEGNIYSDFHLWNDGPNDYLDVAWIDTLPATNKVYYCRYLLNADGTATNLTEPQTVRVINCIPPITLMVDSEGYPYIAYPTYTDPNYSGQVAWSNTNNGIFNHSAESPASSETGVTGYNPPNNRGPYIHELIKGGNRRIFCAVHVPDAPPELCIGISGRIVNSGSWIGEGDYLADTANGYDYRWALSGSSIRDPDDPFNASITHLDFNDHELYERPVNVWVQNSDLWDTTRVMIMGATTDGIYYTIGYTQNQRYSRWRLRRGSWSATETLRDFTEYGATHDIGLWQLTAHKYPTKDENKTIVSYAWRDAVATTFWHDWFYLEDGPDENVTDGYWIAQNNETLTDDDLPGLIDQITGEDPDPEDPGAGDWTGDEILSRNRTKLLIFIIGFLLFLGTPTWGFIARPDASRWVIIAMCMLSGLALLWSIPSM